jgi:hypothetical protein
MHAARTTDDDLSGQAFSARLQERKTLNFKLALQKTADSLRRDGFLATIRKVLVQLTYGRAATMPSTANTHGHRRTHSIMEGQRPLAELPLRRPYRAIAEDELTDAVRFLGDDLRDFVFIDLGCGNGRTLLITARLGFHSAVGVEFADELAVILGDATEYEIPRSNLVVYLYNAEPMRKVVRQPRSAHLRDFPRLKLS